MAKRKANDRKAILEQMRKEQQAQERRRTMLILGACIAVGLAIIAAVAIPILKNNAKQSAYESRGLDKIGVSPSAAKCQPLVTKNATGNNDHRAPGSVIPYDNAPPAFGPHYPTPAPMARKFYTAKDRPQVETLVHNLEHGYNIVWYDDTVAGNSDEVAQLKAIAAKFPGTSKLENKFIVAPWTADDGEAFPGGAHVALTHWSIGGDNPDPNKQIGIWEYCSSVSGAAVATFVKDYPYSDSPEPGAM